MTYLSHQLIVVKNLEKSIRFFCDIAQLQLVHRRVREGGQRVAWVANGENGARLILVEGPPSECAVGPYGHLGLSARSADEYAEMLEVATAAGLVREGPKSQPWPICDWFSMSDPDGNRVEISWGQDQLPDSFES